MGKSSSSSSRKRDRDGDRDESSSSKKSSSSSSSSKKHHRSHEYATSSKQSRVIDDSAVGDEEDEWVEKEPSSSVQSIPTSKSLALTSAPSSSSRAPYPVTAAVSRDTKGTFDPRTNSHHSTLPALEGSSAGFDLTDGFGTGDVGSTDFFSSLGTERTKPVKDAPDPDRGPKISKFEINKGIFDKDGFKVEHLPASTAAPTVAKKIVPGSSGSSWRMSKLKRVYETAQEEGRSVEEVARERYATEEAWEEAKEERRVLDERDRPPAPTVDEFGREIRTTTTTSPASASASQTRFIFNNPGNANELELSRPPSRNASFRRPGEAQTPTTVSTPTSRYGTPKPATPIPSVFTPPPISRNSSTRAPPPADGQQRKRALSPSSLNKLQAKVLKAKLLDADADSTRILEQEYETELKHSQNVPPPLEAEEAEAAENDGPEVRVLPTLDGRGRLYDLGAGAPSPDAAASGSDLPGNKKRRRGGGDKFFESRDIKTGELLRYNADDDTTTLSELVRQERFGAGSKDQKSLDEELASRIGGDAGFKDDLDYMDESAERLARKKMRTNDQKRLFAVQGSFAPSF